MPLMRIPYTAPLPAPTIYPASASTIPGAVAALYEFLTAPSSTSGPKNGKTVLLTGAGISVASGLADYRGTNGTYTLNKTYRPVYYHEFCANHEARKRYWARSYLGWTNLHKSKPNAAHHAVARLGEMGHLSSIITQSTYQTFTWRRKKVRSIVVVVGVLTRTNLTDVDSFHPKAHPTLRTLELHGYLRSAVCISCRTEYDRSKFQSDLSTLNPAWAAFLAEMIESGALSTENPEERRRRGLKTNPDGDVDIPGIEYGTFRYPACPSCLANPPSATEDGKKKSVEVDGDGAWLPSSTAGVLKPAVIMFGESIPGAVKEAAEQAIDEASRVLVLGSSLATYSAWRLIRRAKEAGMSIGIANLGGVRGEEQFYTDLPVGNKGARGVRCAQVLEKLLPELVTTLQSGASVDLQSRPPFVPAYWR